MTFSLSLSLSPSLSLFDSFSPSCNILFDFLRGIFSKIPFKKTVRFYVSNFLLRSQGPAGHVDRGWSRLRSGREH